MSDVEFETYEKYKNQPIGPFKLVRKPIFGWDVETLHDLNEKTIICSYIG
jgi:hypothetical protein